MINFSALMGIVIMMRLQHGLIIGLAASGLYDVVMSLYRQSMRKTPLGSIDEEVFFCLPMLGKQKHPNLLMT